ARNTPWRPNWWCASRQLPPWKEKRSGRSEFHAAYILRRQDREHTDSESKLQRWRAGTALRAALFRENPLTPDLIFSCNQRMRRGPNLRATDILKIPLRIALDTL